MTETKGAGYSRTTLWVLFCCCVAPLDGNVYGSVSTQETVTGNYQGIGYKLDAWSQYDNPEEAGRQEGDIELAPASRKTVTRREKLLWPNGVVKYHVHESIGDAFNFRVLAETEANTFGLPYDYDSIMHYPMTAFSVNKSSPTLIPLRKNARIGQRIHLSFYDIEKLLISYECKTFNADNLYMALGHGHPDVLQLLSFNVSKLYKLQSFKHLKDYKDAFKNYGSPDFDDFDSRRHFRRERISNDY
ncbi:uncharacterized protein LOC105701071 isoform X2 [Orussus abietinus]|uniref:uncharacterized protein LOC105701071 isoform X2 n=1 Tax=Orussus abietinus TaxID=222816 RepID=UPI000625A53E|nr:uncharacterized protein LOC105701071 isoform X2 [Orussus abietinus]